MKTRLDQLTLQQLIDLSCGEYAVLCENDELPTDKELVPKVTSIIAEYRAIASPAQARMELMDAEKMSKFGLKEKCARICMLLCMVGRWKKAREVLTKLGIEEVHLSTEEAVIARCQAIIGEVKYETERMAQMKSKSKGPISADQVRREWYSEIAGVMSTLKVPVPMDINAAIYANLVHQAVERNKALSKMPPMAGMFM